MIDYADVKSFAHRMAATTTDDDTRKLANGMLDLVAEIESRDVRVERLREEAQRLESALADVTDKRDRACTHLEALTSGWSESDRTTFQGLLDKLRA